MIWSVANNEIRVNLLSLKFNLLFLLCLIIFIVGAYSMAIQSNAKLRDYYNNRKRHIQEIDQGESFAEVGIYGVKIDRFPEKMSVFASGLEAVKSRIYKVSIVDILPMGGSDYERNPFIALNGSLDLLFLIKFVISLVSILGVYDVITREQENSLMKLNFSFNLSRYEYVLGKYFGNFLTVGAAFTLSFLTAVLIFVVELNTPFKVEEWLRISVIFFVSLSFISVIILSCFLVSSIFSRSNIVLLSSMLIWMFYTIVIPYSVPNLIEIFHAPPSISEKQMRLFNIDKATDRQALKKVREYYDENEQRPSQKWLADLREKLLLKSYDKKKDIKTEYDNKLHQFIKLTANIARISPTSVYQSCMQSLSNTDLISENKMLNRLEIFQNEFMEYINEKLANSAEITQVDKITLSKMLPSGQISKISISNSLQACIWNLGLLILYNIILLASSIFLFNIKSI